jgi:hypothetical protein
MSDLRLNSGNFSLDLTNGQFAIIDGQDAAIQALRLRLTAFTQEWFLDLAEGLPYFTQILVKGVNQEEIAQIYRNEIQNTPGIESVETLEFGFGNSDFRLLTITAQVKTTTGTTITITTGL